MSAANEQAVRTLEIMINEITELDLGMTILNDLLDKAGTALWAEMIGSMDRSTAFGAETACFFIYRAAARGDTLLKVIIRYRWDGGGVPLDRAIRRFEGHAASYDSLLQAIVRRSSA